MPARLASFHALGTATPSRPEHLSEAPVQSRSDVLKALLRSHRRQQALQRLVRMRQHQRAASKVSWVRGIWEGRHGA